MSKFDYRGFGDGTNWSFEKGDMPKPDKPKPVSDGGPTENSTNSCDPVSEQISAIQSDQKVRQALINMLHAARRINSAAKMTLLSVAPSGIMEVSIEGITVDQASQVGLERKLYGFRASGYVGVLGQIDTGHRLDLTGVCVPRNEITADGFISGKISANEWHTVAKDNWADAGPVNSGLINNAIKSVQITRKTLIKDVYTPDEVMNKAEYKAMRQAFNSLPLDKQGKAIKQIVTAWSLACQVFPVNLKNEIGRVTERVADDINLAFILNETASQLSKATKDVEVANEVIKETVKAINQVNLKIASKRTQQKSQADLMSKKQKEVADLKNLFKNHSYHPIQDAQRVYDDARNKISLLESDIRALQAQVSELNLRKKQAEQKIAAAAKVKAEAAAKAAAEKKAAEAKEKADAEKVRKEIETKANDEKAVLTKASEIIISVGDKVGDYLGDNYKTLSREISENIKNFQGKTIRSYDEAMTSINKLMVNPSLKINAADKEAIVNAWMAFDAEDMGNKFAGLGKTFRVADYVVKANNVRVKSIEGYQTGNWGPLVREVESWVISGIASAVALSFLSYTLGSLAVWFGASALAAGIIAIILAGIIGSMIDNDFIEKLNSQIIRSVY